MTESNDVRRWVIARENRTHRAICVEAAAEQAPRLSDGNVRAAANPPLECDSIVRGVAGGS